MSSVELKEKTEHTSITGTEWLYLQLAATPYTVLKIALDTIKDWIVSVAILDYLFPVGTVVFQPPAAESDTESVAFPVADRPATKYGGTWSELYEDEAIVFRTFGESESRSSGYQEDAMQRITGSLGGPAIATAYYSKSGVFTDTTVTTVAWSYTGGNYIGTVQFDSANSTSPNAAKTSNTETRMKNRRMKVWIRTA